MTFFTTNERSDPDWKLTGEVDLMNALALSLPLQPTLAHSLRLAVSRAISSSRTRSPSPAHFLTRTNPSTTTTRPQPRFHSSPARSYATMPAQNSSHGGKWKVALIGALHPLLLSSSRRTPARLPDSLLELIQRLARTQGAETGGLRSPVSWERTSKSAATSSTPRSRCGATRRTCVTSLALSLSFYKLTEERCAQFEGRKLTEVINEKHENVKYLPGIDLGDNVVAEPDLIKAIEGANALIFVIPHQVSGRVHSWP